MQIGDTFYYNPDDNESVKYYEARSSFANENGLRLVECEPADITVTEEYETDDEKGNIVTRTRQVEKRLRQFRIDAVPDPTVEEINAQRVSELKRFLADTDYVVIKIAEGSATAEEYADVIAQRQAARAEINSLDNDTRNE